MSTIITDYIQADEISARIPISELGGRIIKTHQQWYDGGYWRNDNNYNWVPGLWHDYTPERADSRIRATVCFTYCGPNANAEAICHMKFFSNTTTEQGRHTVAGYHVENRGTFVWDFASWGTTQGRIGYQQRQYNYGSHEATLHSTRYWDGGGSNQNCRAHFVIEEYLSQGL